MKKSTAFRRAAQRIDNKLHIGCCAAIAEVLKKDGRDKQLESLQAFKDYLQPKQTMIFWWWWHSRERNKRVLALLFAAAIAESEGD